MIGDAHFFGSTLVYYMYGIVDDYQYYNGIDFLTYLAYGHYGKIRILAFGAKINILLLFLRNCSATCKNKFDLKLAEITSALSFTATEEA